MQLDAARRLGADGGPPLQGLRRRAARSRRPHEQADRRHRRPPQRRQVHPLQPHRRRPAGDRVGAARHHARPPLRRRRVGRAAASGWWTPAGWCPTRTTRWTAPSGGRWSSRSTSRTSCVFLVDGKEGVHPVDQAIAERLRRAGRPVLLVVNKLDDLRAQHRASRLLRARLRRSGRRERRDREGKRRPARRGGRAAPARRIPRRTRTSSTSRWWAGPTWASPRWSIGCWARSATSWRRRPGTTRDAIDSLLRYRG